MEKIRQYFLIPILALLSLVLTGSNASLPAQVYWKSHLPNTPMPKALQELLHIDGGITSDFLKGSLIAVERGKRVTYGTGYWSESQAFEKGQIFNATTVYFQRNNLRPYKKMNIIFTKSITGVNFLPIKAAKSIPFSTSKLAQILNYTSINSNSNEAKVMKQTIEECEAPGIKGEDKHCATSLESLVDYVVSKLGKRVKTVSNQVEEENKEQVYTIQKGIKMMGEKNHVVCHKERYAYAVYYCHKIRDTNVYVVPMIGEDGSKGEAVVVCHLDTSDWNPKHYSFQVLNEKPGGAPVCHFVNSDTIVWLPN
ncbi:BURP domain-containing protein 3-like [Euphorbia lathyris]|uniref:BURP domain-containing protein 3-like n=1 Tax=Euphorbia lathyris TaxID=212925 RepID=UPI003313C9D8